MLNPIVIARFTTAQAAAACGVTTDTLAALVTRGVFPLTGGEEPVTRTPGKGRSRLFSAQRVLHMALTTDLIGCGLPAAAASRMAMLFTDLSQDETAVATLENEPRAEIRMPCDVFKTGKTIFRVSWVRGRGEPIGCVTSGAAFKKDMFHSGHEESRAVLAIDLNSLRRRVLTTLGMRDQADAA